MREHKFRAYHEDSGMVYFDFHKVSVGLVLFEDGDWRLLKDCKVMQFTGRKDSNGVDLFDGDILHLQKDALTNSPWDDINKPVYFENGMFMVFDRTVYQASTLFKYKFEIIGNIHEHKHLLDSKTGGEV